MKIIQLTAENVKKLTAVEISPDGNMVQITGKNGQGKTSVLDCIWWALAGERSIQKQPIRKGADSARIELKLGAGKVVELIVERRFTETASYLSVKTADGAKYPNPQKLASDLFGALTFDPLEFMRGDGKEQFDILKKLVKLDIDLEADANAGAADYAKRTDVNRDAKAKRAQANAIAVEDGLPESLLDESALLDAMQRASETNADIERRKANRETAIGKVAHLSTHAEEIEASVEPGIAALQSACDRDCADIESQIVTLTARMNTLKERIAGEIEELKTGRIAAAHAARSEAAELQRKLDAAGELPEPADIAALRASLDAAKETNLKIKSREQKKRVETEAESLEAQSEALTNAIEARAAARLEAIGRAEMPVPGLSFGEGVVTFNDLPLDQASDAEQLTISTAIAAALNPKLRVIRIRDGSLLDDDAMKRLATFADERDMQIWIERVDGSGTVGIVMEDGHVKGHAPAVPTDAETLTDNLCKGLAAPEINTIPDLDDLKSRGQQAIKDCEIPDEEKSVLLGRLNTAYLERKRILTKGKRAA